MSCRDLHCIMPPSPELELEISEAKQRLIEGASPDDAAAGTRFDGRSLTLILARPAKTRGHTLVSPTQQFAPVVGVRRAIVLLVDFSDEPATKTQQHYKDMLFSTGSYATGSMRDFYKEASYGKLDVVGEVSGTAGLTSGWYRAPRPKSYYTNNDYGFGSYPQNAQKLVEDVIDLAAPHVNFAPFDNDGDGFVEALVVICAGSGGEQTGDKSDFWSHKWGIGTKTVSGVKINSYFMAPEDGRVGVMAHELGHLLLGLPDLYDTDYSSRGTGRWDLMAGGSWNNGGDTPAHPSAWCKAKVGWVNPVQVLNAAQSVNISPYSDAGDVYKMPIGSSGSKEYFLISNRQKKKFDQHLPGEGMIIEHVDENQTNNTDESHYLVDIEQADGARHLNTNANSGDNADPFPSSGNDRFDAGSNPNSKAYDGSDPKISATTIARSGDRITADLSSGGVSVAKWYQNLSVTRVYSTNDAANAWAIVSGLTGWRKIQPGKADGVTNVVVVLCEALANSRKVSVYADDTTIYRVLMA